LALEIVSGATQRFIVKRRWLSKHQQNA
jgi:hypothetical protein